jgi:hypothetical protein
MSSGPRARPKLQPCFGGSALVGLIISISFAVSWILYINHLVDTAQVNLGVEHWIETARTQAYGVCYDGCSDCLDVGSIEKACRMTTKANVSGAICDASKLWTWANRYPVECLQAVGDIYKAGALWWKKFWYRALYILTMLSLPLGLLAYSATSWLLERFNIPALPNRRPRLRRGRQGSNSTTPLLTAATLSVLALALATPAAAYPCMNYHPAHNQLFANADGTLYGVIHGWLSNCYDYTYSCGESCTTSPPSDGGSGGASCSAIYCTQPRTDTAPADFVRAAARHVTECGLRLVDVVPGVVDRRIANPRIEGRLWVKVAVNRFNGSEGVEEQVRCLYDMVEAPRW